MASSMLGDLTVSFKVDLSGLSSGISQAKSEMSGMGSAASSASGTMSSSFMGTIGSLISFGAQVGQTIFGIQQLAGGAVNLAHSLLQPAATAETTELSFTTLLHSTQAAHQEMQALNTFAASTPMQTQWVDNAAAKILAFGGTTKDVIPEITAIGDSLSGLGKLSETSLNSIVDIFGKISAQGKLTGGDMMQLSTWGIPAWNALSEAMHKPIPELQKMVSAGLIPASQAIPALEAGMEKTFGGGMAKQANTFTGIISTLASNWQIAMAALGSPVLKLAEQGLTRIGSVLSSSAFQDFATGVGQRIADVFARIGTSLSGLISGGSGLIGFFQQIGQGWKSIGWDAEGNSVMPGIIAAFGRLQQAAQNFGSTIGPLLGPILLNINALLTTLAGWILKLVAPALDMMSQRVNAVTAFLRPVLAAVNPLITSLINLANAIMPVVVGIVSWVSQSGILTPIMAGLGSIVGNLIGILASLINLIAQVAFFFEQNKIAGTLLMGALSGLAAGFIFLKAVAIAQFIAGLVELLPVMVTLATMAIPEMIVGLGGMAVAGWLAIAPFLPFIAIGLVVAAVIAGIVYAVTHWAQIAPVLQSAWGAVGNFFAGLWRNIQGFFGGIGPWFHDRFTEAANAVSSAFAPVKNFFGGIGASLQSAGAGMKSSSQSIFSSIGSGIQSGLQAALSGIAGFFTTAGKTILLGWQIMLQGVVNAGKWLYDHNYYVKDAVDFVVNVFNAARVLIIAAWTITTAWITSAWLSFVNFSISIWDAVAGAIRSAWTTVSGWLTSAWRSTASTATSIWGSISSAIQSAWRAATGAIMAIWTPVANALFAAWRIVVSTATSIWASVTNAFKLALGAVAVVVMAGWTIVSNYFNTQFNLLLTSVRTLWTNISHIFASIWSTYIAAPLNSFLSSWNRFWQGVISGALNVGKNIIQAVANGISSAAGAVGNAIHSAISSALSGLGFHDIPGLVGHAGGIFNSPTGHFAMVGERGPELMYIPQGSSVFPNGSLPAPSSTPQASSAGSGGSSGGENHFHIYIGGKEVAHEVMNQAMREVRTRTGMRI